MLPPHLRDCLFLSPNSFAAPFLYSPAITKGPLLFIWLLNYAYFMLHETLNELKVYNIKSLALQGWEKLTGFIKLEGSTSIQGNIPGSQDFFDGSGKRWWIPVSIHASGDGDFWARCSLAVGVCRCIQLLSRVLWFWTLEKAKNFRNVKYTSKWRERVVKREERRGRVGLRCTGQTWPSRPVPAAHRSQFFLFLVVSQQRCILKGGLVMDWESSALRLTL